MAAKTGRTVGKHTLVYLDDSGGTLRQIAVATIGGLGITYDEVDLTALQDAVKGILPGHGALSLTLAGPMDSTASTGSHIVLSGVNGESTPLAFDVRVGIRQAWESGEPQFGITGTSANGVLVTDYQVDPAAGMYTAKLNMFSGSAIPAWGTAAET
jgi:hypothetical protein